MQAAAQLHRAFVLHLAKTLGTPPSLPGMAPPLLATSPDSAVDQFTEIGPAWSVQGQGPGDLGQRLQRMFQNQLNDDLRLLVIGADCPDLPPPTLTAAWQHLDSADVVLGPASDGGYYLLGLRGPWQPWMSHLFTAIAWSQADVADTTRQRIAQQGRVLAELETRDDVDTLADLQRLIRRLTTANPLDHAMPQRLLASIAAIVPDQVAAGTAADSPSPDNSAPDNSAPANSESGS